MLRTRRWLPAATFALLAASSPGWAGSLPIDYGTAELGQIKTACFIACFGQNCNASGTISSLLVDPPFFVRGIRRGPASSTHLCDNTSGVTTPVNLPAAVGAGQALVWDVDLVPTQQGNQHSFLFINQDPAFSLESFVAPVTSCNPSTSATCLTDDRFKVRVNWRTGFGTRGPAQVVPFGSDDSGLFFFFNSNNWEMLLKVLNACSLSPPRFWVFAAATTNVEYTITVTDTESQSVKTYFNPLGNPAQPIQDTSAFATCP
jgi:hypothetical protein